MATIRSFEDLECWQQARWLSKAIRQASKYEPFARDFALRDQICRSSSSIMSNIAEGFERRGIREFLRYLRIAKSSAAETQSHLYEALDAGYLDPEEFTFLWNSAKRTCQVIGGLIRYLTRNAERGTRNEPGAKFS